MNGEFVKASCGRYCRADPIWKRKS